MSISDFQGSGWASQPLQQQKQMAEEAQSGTEDVSTDQGSEDGSSGYSEFISQILKDAPDEHKTIMEPYIKKFDASVQRRFQDLHNKYKPYADLGWDEETTQQIAEVYRILNDEPERLYEALKAELEISEEQNQDAEDGQESAQVLQGLPPEIKAQLDQQQQVLEAIASYVLQEHGTKQEAAEDAELNEYLDLLKKEFGEFDEDYVLTKIANGQDGEAAVKSWYNMIQEHINKASKVTDGLPPATLSSAGGGALPVGESQKLGQVSSKDIRALITNVLGQANQAGQ